MNRWLFVAGAFLLLLLPASTMAAEGPQCDYKRVERVVLAREYATGTELVREYDVYVAGGCKFISGETIAFGDTARGKSAYELKMKLIREGKGELLMVGPGTEFSQEVLAQWRREGYDAWIERASARGENPFRPSRPSPTRRTVEVLINGKRAGCEVVPQIRSDRVFLPFRCIVEGINGKVNWNDRERRIDAVRGERRATLWVGRKTMIANGNTVQLDVAPYIVSGRTLVPVRALSEALGANVEWDSRNTRVLIEVD